MLVVRLGLRAYALDQERSDLVLAVDSTHLLTGGADNMCKLWNVQTGECLHTWKHTAPVRDVRFAMGDKQFLSVLDNIMGNVPTIFVWDLELNNLANHPGALLAAPQSPLLHPSASPPSEA